MFFKLKGGICHKSVGAFFNVVVVVFLLLFVLFFKV